MPAGLPPRLLAVLVPVCGAGAATLAWAAYRFGSEPHSGRTLLGLALLVMASMFAERFPVPVEGADAGGVSLLYVFVVATIVLFGWQTGALLAAIGTFTQLLQHRPLIRVSYNAAVFGISAAVAGAAILWLDTHNIWELLAAVGIASFVDYSVNMLLITLIVSVHSGRSFTTVLVLNARGTIIPFALMGSAALMLVVLWQRSPVLSAALVGPLIAISLYQRSTHRALRAMRLALTDPLTGLGNHRHFHERLQRELLDGEELGHPVTLCLVDIDDFKQVNDGFGHPAGDRVLSQVAARLRQGGESFRLGGDEFAVLLPGHDERAALVAASSIVERISGLAVDPVGSVTVSAGVATYPYQGVGRDEKAVDARDVYTGSHSERVAELAARIAECMGVDAETIELTRLAASLHDLGKLAIPEEILRKPGALTESERLVLERHPQIGYRMLESLGVEPLAQWVLHHHERWDGGGYPNGLPGEEIPLGARIIFVADAYDAMTSDRVYRQRLSDEDAMAELVRCAGSQFDPDVVTAFASELRVELEAAAV